MLVEVSGGLIAEEAPKCARAEPIPEHHMSANMLSQNHLQDAGAAVSLTLLCDTACVASALTVVPDRMQQDGIALLSCVHIHTLLVKEPAVFCT